MRLSEHDASRFVDWLGRQVIEDARGTHVRSLDINPAGRFWLGTVASEEKQLRSSLGDRGERLDPSAMGFRLQPMSPDDWSIEVEVRFRLWLGAKDDWHKSEEVVVNGSFHFPSVERQEDSSRERAPSRDSARLRDRQLRPCSGRREGPGSGSRCL